MYRIEIANKYITHHEFNDMALCGKKLKIPCKAQLLNLRIIDDDKDSQIPVQYVLVNVSDNNLVCLPNSENSKKHFAINDDGEGLERGQLTYAIAYGDRQRLSANGGYYRFSDEEVEMIFDDYERWIRPGIDVIIFNDDFFTADVEELRELAQKLDIHI